MKVDYIMIFQGDVDVHMNPNEVKSIRYVDRTELESLFEMAGKWYKLKLDRGEVKITPWFRLIVKHMLYKWWDRLDELEKMKDTQTIHRL